MKLGLMLFKLMSARHGRAPLLIVLGLLSGHVAGFCDTAIAGGVPDGNIPPTVSIVSPTNESVFLAPAHFTIVADAADVDGAIAEVKFLMQSTNLGTVGPVKLANQYSTGVTNVPVGDYILTVVVTDNGGLSSTSAPVIIHVRSLAPITVVSPIQFNPQTGLFQQTVQVGNLAEDIFAAVRVYVDGLVNGTTVYNASGTNGAPYLQSLTSIAPGGSLDMMIEYYSPFRTPPNPTFFAEVLPTKPGATPTPSGTEIPVSRALFLPDGTFLLEFPTTTNRFYVVEYSGDLKGWTAVQQPPIAGNGTSIQWIDNGQPKTESVPAAAATRFYRIILLPLSP